MVIGLPNKTSSDALAANIETPIATIFLPIPENIQDSNAVNWGDDSLNGLAARGIGLSAAAIGSDKDFVKTAKDFFTGAGAFAEDFDRNKCRNKKFIYCGKGSWCIYKCQCTRSRYKTKPDKY